MKKVGKTLQDPLGIPAPEGSDGTPDGAPTETVFRRYERYACGSLKGRIQL